MTLSAFPSVLVVSYIAGYVDGRWTAIDGIRSKLQHFLGWNTKDQDKVAIKQRVRDFAPIVFFDFDFTLDSGSRVQIAGWLGGCSSLHVGHAWNGGFRAPCPD